MLVISAVLIYVFVYLSSLEVSFFYITCEQLKIGVKSVWRARIRFSIVICLDKYKIVKYSIRSEIC